jgi:hypothetical protein
VVVGVVVAESDPGAGAGFVELVDNFAEGAVTPQAASTMVASSATQSGRRTSDTRERAIVLLMLELYRTLRSRSETPSQHSAKIWQRRCPPCNYGELMAKSGNSRLQGFGSMWHLGVRFLGALAPVGPRSSSEQWALGHLLPTERELFVSMSGADRRHAVGVARRALRLAEQQHLDVSEPGGAFVAAALLHDVGKIDARLGTFGRVWATLAALGLGRDRVIAWEKLADPAGARGGAMARQGAKMARYLQHDRIGAELLEGAGSDQLTITWARDHHLPEQRWSVDRRLGECLKHADGD